MSYSFHKHRQGGSAVGSSSLTVSWVLPLTNADGSALGTMTDQTVFYDTVPRMGTGVAYANSTSVGSSSATSKVISGLFSGTTYYFAVAAVISGVRSDYSIETSGTVAP